MTQERDGETDPPRPPAGPRDTLVYAIGDIHGCAALLDELLAMIVEDAAGAGARRRVLVFVGDYVDRGPDSAGVIERLSSGLPENFESICLKGNHEALMLDFMARPEEFDLWLHNGGAATLASYDVSCEAFITRANGATLCRDAFIVAMPEHHRAFLRGLRLSASLGDYFFAHAGVWPGVALEEQSAHDLMWIRHEFLNSDADFGKLVVHGHTPKREPEMRANRIGIDTGAWMRGTLTALRLHGDAQDFLTTRGWE